MLSILRPNSDEVIKSVEVPIPPKEEEPLRLLCNLSEQEGLFGIIALERQIVSELQGLINFNITNQDFLGNTSYQESIRFLKYNRTVKRLFKRLFIISAWRDKCFFYDFNLYPTNLQPFIWLQPLLTAKYTGVTEETIAKQRIDWSAYYYMRKVCADEVQKE